jgi:hypothetical protein
MIFAEASMYWRGETASTDGLLFDPFLTKYDPSGREILSSSLESRTDTKLTTFR